MIFQALKFLTGLLLGLVCIKTTNQSFFCLLLAGLVLLCFRRSSLQSAFQTFLLGISWASVAIIFWLEYSSQSVPRPMSVHVQGYICSIPSRDDAGWRFDFCLQRIQQQPLPAFQRNKIRLRWGNYAAQPPLKLKAGQYWQFESKLKPLYSRLNPQAFDYSRWLLVNGYAGSGYIKRVLKAPEPVDSVNAYQHFRQSVFNRLETTLLGEPRIASNHIALIKGIVTGERGDISQSQWQVFRDTGTSHLLAISGLHVGIAATWSYWLVFFIWRSFPVLCQRIPAQSAARLAMLAGGLAIALISGFGLPAQRASIMLAVFWLGNSSGRHLSLLSSLSVALWIILLIQPFAVLSESFWLSFIAVFCIALVTGQKINSTGKFRTFLKVNWCLYLIMIPVGLWFFTSSSLVAFVANLILIPLYSLVITPLLYLGALLNIVLSDVAEFLFRVCAVLFEWSYWLQLKLAAINELVPAFSQKGSGGVLLLVSTAMLALVFILPKPLVGRSLLLPVLLSVFLVSQKAPVIKDTFNLWVFDVGQGLAIYMQTPQNNLLYDTAWGNDDYAVAESSIMPFLEQSGVKQIDRLIISHNDSDHFGGFDRLSGELSFGEVWYGEKEDLIPQDWQNCHEGGAWRWATVTLHFLPVPQHARDSANNSSCVLSIALGTNYRILLAGDIEEKAETALVRAGLERHNLVIAPHHGSKTSSSAAFVSRLKAEVVVFSTGFNNQWGFPKQEVVDRYHDNGASIWVTHLHGAIQLSWREGKPPKIRSLRQQAYYFWRRIPD